MCVCVCVVIPCLTTSSSTGVSSCGCEPASRMTGAIKLFVVMMNFFLLTVIARIRAFPCTQRITSSDRGSLRTVKIIVLLTRTYDVSRRTGRVNRGWMSNGQCPACEGACFVTRKQVACRRCEGAGTMSSGVSLPLSATLCAE